MELLKQCVGIDISKDTFAASYAVMDANQAVHFKANNLFENDISGFKKLTKWVNENIQEGTVLWYVLEATGVYYENLAYYLVERTTHINVLIPSRAKYFAKSLKVKTKTDKMDAKILVQLGLERKLDPWRIVSPKIKEMKELCREYRWNKADLTRFKNRLHAKMHSYKPNARVIGRLKQKIRMLETHCLTIEYELQELVSIDPILEQKVEKLTSIPGLGFMTVVCIISETNGFAAIRNTKQLASYAGLDVVHAESGTKVGKTKISKKGNNYIRRALYMPAMAARRHNADLKKFYERIIKNKPAKKIGITAIARKMLILTYVLWKNDEFFKTQSS